jgi:hypothetical protein
VEVTDVDILVAQLAAETFRVTVTDRGLSTVHEVTLPRHARHGLGLHGVPPVRIVDESLRFLLEREPPDRIDSRLLLPAIAGRYPEYPEEIRVRVTG